MTPSPHDLASPPTARTGPALPAQENQDFIIERVPKSRLAEAACRLLGVAAGETAAANQFLDQSRAAGTDLSLMWDLRATHPSSGVTGPIRQVVLVAPSPGRTAAVFVSDGSPGVPPFLPAARRAEDLVAHRERVALLRHLSSPDQPVARAGVDLSLAQALLEPEQTVLLAAFSEAGFQRLADLAYMRRKIPRRPRATTRPMPAGIEVHTIADLGAQGMADLKIALDRTYVQTLDCPALCGLRSVDDIIASHLAVGDYDPKLWWIVSRDRQPEGCMLLSPQAGEETTELVYLGLSPSVRGLGLGRWLFEMGLDRLARGSDRTLACAVDLVNTPARRLYASLEFEHFATRLALISTLR